MDLVAEHDQVQVARWQEKQDEVMDMCWCMVAAHDRSMHVVFVVVHHKPSGYLVEPQNQDRRLGRRRWDSGTLRSLDAGEHTEGSRGLCLEDVDCGEGMVAR
jgi:hypothetical protein